MSVGVPWEGPGVGSWVGSGGAGCCGRAGESRFAEPLRSSVLTLQPNTVILLLLQARVKAAGVCGWEGKGPGGLQSEVLCGLVPSTWPSGAGSWLTARQAELPQSQATKAW